MINDISFFALKCPPGYETLTATFAGTETYCERSFQKVYAVTTGQSFYTVGECINLSIDGDDDHTDETS